MFGSSWSKRERFSFLLLDEGEYYVEDHIAIYFPLSDQIEDCISNQIRGVLRITSKSLIFDPNNCSLPIVKYHFSKIVKIKIIKKGELANYHNGLIMVIKSKETIHMKENNLIKPYVFNNAWNLSSTQSPFGAVDENEYFVHQFGVRGLDASGGLDRIMLFHELSGSNSAEHDETINQIVKEKEMTQSFDITWMDSIDEEKLFQASSFKIFPLMKIPGKILITNKFIYFQPIWNFSASPMEKYKRDEIVGIKNRRYELRNLTCEVFFLDEDLDVESLMTFYYGNGRSMLFSFVNENDRVEFYNLLINDSLKRLQMEDAGLDHSENMDVSLVDTMTFSDSEFRSCYTPCAYLRQFFTNEYPSLMMVRWWQNGLISNFDYLLYLNLLANRSFNDLTQYPVFPWVLIDYDSETLNLNDSGVFRDLTKPVGALNPARLKHYLERYAQTLEAENGGFMYGTHYSTPGYVLFYLARRLPECMLKFQNGRFDEPNRLFNSIKDAWDNVMHNTADLKELIPEFFDIENDRSDFLLNKSRIDFGICQSGLRVDDVVLPPWAIDSEDFVFKNRMALESQFVSENLNHWIDLIFGYKQNGPLAIESHNLYHPLTYQNAIDPQSINSHLELSGIIHQINEFGQAPHQLFFLPHPKKFNKNQIPTPDLIQPHPSYKFKSDLQSSSHHSSPSLSTPSHLTHSPNSSSISISSPTPVPKPKKISSSSSTSKIIEKAETLFDQFAISLWFHNNQHHHNNIAQKK